jgi:signal transduction histidine kinase/ActR/RegA family two-component response regulator
MIISQECQDRGLTMNVHSASAPTQQENRLAADDSLISILQNLADEARALLGARSAAMRIALDEDGTRFLSADSFTQAPEHGPEPAEHARHGPTLSVPLVNGAGRAFGTMEATAQGGASFTAEDETRLGQLAKIASLAVENMRHYHDAPGSLPAAYSAAVSWIGPGVAPPQHDQGEQHERLAEVHQDLQYAQKMEVFGQLAGGVVHDFNNLLTVILGYSEILMHNVVGGYGSHELLSEIHKAAGRAESLTRQLLDFSRLHDVEMKVLDLNPIVSDTEKILRRLIGEDILMTTVFAPNLWLIKADPGQMQQVILNLAVNARDAMPKGGHLTIETDNVTLDEAYCQLHPYVRPGSYARLAVSDTGIGMNAATKARVFEPLFTTKAPGKGTGLGLSTVKNIIKQSGGHIEVYTELGCGTTFKVYLPQAHEPKPTAASSSDVRVLPRGTETILLVEDDDAIRFLARRILENCGYTVLEASNGEDALVLAQAYQGPLHLLVSDVVMPHVSGRCLADRLLAAVPALKVLFVSGYTNDAVLRHGVLDAECAFLQKPFATADLAQKVRFVLDQEVPHIS